MDQFSYLPETQFGFGGATNLGVPGWAARWPLLHQASLEALHQIRPFSVLLDRVTVMPSRRSRRTLSLVRTLMHMARHYGSFALLSTQEM